MMSFRKTTTGRTYDTELLRAPGDSKNRRRDTSEPPISTNCWITIVAVAYPSRKVDEAHQDEEAAAHTQVRFEDVLVSRSP